MNRMLCTFEWALTISIVFNSTIVMLKRFSYLCKRRFYSVFSHMAYSRIWAGLTERFALVLENKFIVVLQQSTSCSAILGLFSSVIFGHFKTLKTQSYPQPHFYIPLFLLQGTLVICCRCSWSTGWGERTSFVVHQYKGHLIILKTRRLFYSLFYRPRVIYTEYRHGSPSDRHVFIRQLLWLGLATLVISSNSELVNILGRL